MVHREGFLTSNSVIGLLCLRYFLTVYFLLCIFVLICTRFQFLYILVFNLVHCCYYCYYCYLLCIHFCFLHMFYLHCFFRSPQQFTLFNIFFLQFITLMHFVFILVSFKSPSSGIIYFICLLFIVFLVFTLRPFYFILCIFQIVTPMTMYNISQWRDTLHKLIVD